MKVPVVGEFLGRYEIVRTLGSGAMGQVYAAYDESLDREIAVKVLRAQFADDFQRRERFEREAKAIAALDHPNIVTVYSVEEVEGTHFITMQLVDGKTLDEEVPEGGLGTERFLDLTVRLVEAVAAAHQKGVVHRDLKPSNVMVAEDGRLKVLDFGLAKLRVDATGAESLAEPETMGLTLEGQIIGTVAYMSPEQAEGRAADHRSDIFSLGVLMYEMATGEAPFDGDTPISVMSSIIKDTPAPIDRLKPGLPAHLGRIIRTCLAKDPVRRYQTAIDLRNALDDLKVELQSGDFEGGRFGTVPPSTQPEPVEQRSRGAGWLAAAAAVALAFAGGVWWSSGDPLVSTGAGSAAGTDEPAPVRLTSQAGLAGSPAFSPDGSKIGYASDVAGTMDLWFQEADGRTVRVTDFPGNETDPDWAPDDSAFAYTQNYGNDGIQLISPYGGQASQLTSFGSHPKWSPDASRIVFQWRGDVWLVATQGGAEPEVLVRDTAGSPRPVWSADGANVYYWNRSEADVYRISADGGAGVPLGLVPTGQEASGLATAADGSHLVMSVGPYGGNKDMWKVTLGEDGLPAGAPRRLTWPTTDDVAPALSPDGRSMAYAARRVVRHLWAYSYDPESGDYTGASQQLTTAADSNYYPAASPDGQRLVWTAHRTSDQGQLYSMSLDDRIENKATAVWERPVREIGGTFSPTGSEDLLFTSTSGGSYELWRAGCTAECVPTQLTETEHPVRDVLPTWAPDGGRVIFYSNRSGNWDIWSMMLGNGGEMRPLTVQESFEMYPTFSPSGRQFAFWTNRDDGGGDVWVADARNGASPRPFAVSDAQEGWAAWSPDERWFFFASDRSGSFNIWVQPADGRGAARQVTRFASLDHGMPEAVIYTKFAVTDDALIIPVEDRSGGLWLIEDISR